MSMSFTHPVNDEALAKIKDTFGELIAHDRKTFLFDRLRKIEPEAMNEISNAAKQPATVEVSGDGEIKVMSDGTRYQVTSRGWKRLPPEIQQTGEQT